MTGFADTLALLGLLAGIVMLARWAAVQRRGRT